MSWGFKTNYQNVTYDLVTPTFDSFVFKYDPTENNDCFYNDEMRANQIRGVTTSISVSRVEDKTQSQIFRKNNNQYLGYSSRYSGAFDLLDTFRYPKMCAQKSANLTSGVHYYRGQKEMAYIIGKESN